MKPHFHWDLKSGTTPSIVNLLHKDDSVTVWYDERNFMYAEWKGYLSPFALKKRAPMLLRMQKEKACMRIINDLREVKGTWLQIIPWLIKFFFPAVKKMGVEKVALIYLPNSFGQRAMLRTLEVNNHFPAQAFTDYQTAERWLLGKLEQDLPIAGQMEGRILLKDNGKISFINCEEVLYLYSHEKGTAIQSQQDLNFTKVPLKDMSTRLPEHFFQVHRSYIINTHHVKSVRHYDSGSYHIFLKEMPGIKIPVSKRNVPGLRRFMGL